MKKSLYGRLSAPLSKNVGNKMEKKKKRIITFFLNHNVFIYVAKKKKSEFRLFSFCFLFCCSGPEPLLQFCVFVHL